MPRKPKTPEMLKRSKPDEGEEPPTEVLEPADRPKAKPKAKPAAARKKAPAKAKAATPAKPAPKARRAALIPKVQLGYVAANGISPSLYVLIERGVQKRPKIARSIRGTVEIRFEEDFAPVRMVFDADGALVEDADGRNKDWEPDLIIEGSLPDIVQLAAAPLVGGLPKLTDKRGRAALARVADRRVKIDGNPLVARRLLKLLEI